MSDLNITHDLPDLPWKPNPDGQGWHLLFMVGIDLMGVQLEEICQTHRLVKVFQREDGKHQAYIDGDATMCARIKGRWCSLEAVLGAVEQERSDLAYEIADLKHDLEVAHLGTEGAQ